MCPCSTPLLIGFISSPNTLPVREEKICKSFTCPSKVAVDTITVNLIKNKNITMKNENTYNGWSNYETWRVNLELFDGDNETWSHGSPDAMREFAEMLIEESTDEGIGRDYALAFLQNVDWQEIAEYYEVKEEEVA